MSRYFPICVPVAVLSLLVPALTPCQQLPTGTKGTLNLSVQVEDELGYDTVSRVVELKHIRASEIEPFIQARLSRWGAVQVNDALNMVIITDKKAKLNDLVALVRELDSPRLKGFVRLETVSLPLSYTDPNSVKSLLSPQLSQEGSMIVDSAHNALVITDLGSKIDTIRRMLEKIDVFVPQAVIETGVVEVSDDYLRKVGIDWNALRLINGGASASIGGNSYDSSVTYVAPPGPLSENVQAGLTKNWSFNGFLNVDQFFDLVNFLSTKNKADVLTRTRIVAANNQQGSISVGQKVYYRPSGSPPSIENQALGGLTVSVLPLIGMEDVVTLSINANLDDLTGWSPEGSPIFENRSVQSKVALKDGETFVLGGITKTTEVETEGGIPVLKDILPFIFSVKSKTKVKRDVLILLTPHIKREPGYLPEADAARAETLQRADPSEATPLSPK